MTVIRTRPFNFHTAQERWFAGQRLVASRQWQNPAETARLASSLISDPGRSYLDEIAGAGYQRKYSFRALRRRQDHDLANEVCRIWCFL